MYRKIIFFSLKNFDIKGSLDLNSLSDGNLPNKIC